MTVMIRTIKFQGYELKCKCGCGLLNCDNLFLMKLDVFRDKLNIPLEVTSGCRCKKHNKEVGGRENSLHIAEGKRMSAVDIMPALNDLGTGISVVWTKAVKSELFNEIIWYRNNNFIHLGCDPNQSGDYIDIV